MSRFANGIRGSAVKFPPSRLPGSLAVHFSGMGVLRQFDSEQANFRGSQIPRGSKRTHLKLLLPKSSVARTPATPAADAIAYTQTTCSTGAMPTPQSSAANTMDKQI